MASIKTPIASGGTPTQPTVLPFTLPTAMSERWFPRAPISSTNWGEGFFGPIVANGIDRIRHLADGSVLDTGLLAPMPEEVALSTQWTATPNGARADFTFDRSTATPADGSVMVIAGEEITLKTSLDDSTKNQVLIGATASETLDNLRSLLENTTGQGSLYHLENPGYYPSVLEITSKTSSTVVGRLRTYGVVGNKVTAYLKTGFGFSMSLGSQGTTVGTVGYMENGSDGAGDTLGWGVRNYGYRYYRSKDGATSAYDPLRDSDGQLSSVRKSGDQDVDIAGARISFDADTDYWEWVRSLKGGKFTYPGRRVVDSGTTDTDDIPDEDLSTDAVERINPADYRPFVSGHIPKYRHVEEWKGRLWGGGAIRDEDYAGSTANWTNGSRWVEITNGEPAEDWIGKTIIPATGLDDHGEFLITHIHHEDDAATAGKWVVINKVWAGPTGGTAYTVSDRRNPFELGFSQPLRPNNFPPQNTITGIKGNDDEGITGIVSLEDRLVVFTRSSMWVVMEGGPTLFSLHSISKSVGCVSGQSIVEAEGGIFWLGQDGVYAWAGVGKPEKISSPLTQGESVTGIDGTINRINWPHAHLSHARFCPRARIVEFFVPLDSEIIPEHSIVLDLGSRGVFSMGRGVGLTAHGQVRDSNGVPLCIAGDSLGNIIQIDVGDSDGAYGFDPVTTVTASSTTRLVEVGTGTLSGMDVAGAPAIWLAADGTLTFFQIASHDDDSVVPVEDLASAPAADDQVIIGGIHMWLKSGRFTLQEERRWKGIAYAITTHSPVASGEVYPAFSYDQGTPDVPDRGYTVIDLTNVEGRTRLEWAERGLFHQFELQALTPGNTPAILAIELGVVVSGDDNS